MNKIFLFLIFSFILYLLYPFFEKIEVFIMFSLFVFYTYLATLLFLYKKQCEKEIFEKEIELKEILKIKKDEESKILEKIKEVTNGY